MMKRSTTLDRLFAYDQATAHAMQAWFDTCCQRTGSGHESSQALWDSWQTWAGQQEHYLATRKRLGTFLRFQGMQPAVLGSGTVRAWRGVVLRMGEAL